MIVRCIGLAKEYMPNPHFEIGKTYETRNGLLYSDEGYGFGNGDCTTLTKLNNWMGELIIHAKFEEVEDLNTWEGYGTVDLYVEIKITRNGRKLTGKYTVDGKTYTAVAKCNPEDEFDMEYGSKLVVERLMTKYHREITPEPKKLQLIYAIDSDAGEVGIETNLTALFGEKLYVGDTVEIYSTRDGYTSYKAVTCVDGEFGIMGIFDISIDMKNGITASWQVRKVASYDTLKDGDKINNVNVVLK